MISKPSLSTVFVFCAATMACSAQAKSLEEAVAQALEIHPELRALFYQYKSLEKDVEIAKSGWYPKADAYLELGIGKRDNAQSRLGREDEEIKPVEYGVTIEQLLFDGFFTEENVSRTKAEARAEFFTLLSDAENRALEVTRAYTGYIAAQQLLELAERNLASHKDIYAQIEERTNSGLGSQSDLSQVGGRLARANANLLAAKNQLQDARASYFRLVGEAPQDLVMPKPDLDGLPQDKESFLEIAKVEHPTIIAAMSDVKAAHHQIDGNRANYYPRVTLSLEHSSTEYNNDGDNYVDESRISLNVTYNLFNGFADQELEKKSVYQKEQALNLRTSAEFQVIEGAEFAWSSYQYVQEQLEYLRQHVEFSYTTLQAHKQQFTLGRRTLLDLLDTENELFEARKSYVNAEQTALVAHYRIFNAMGTLLDNLKIDARDYQVLGEQ